MDDHLQIEFIAAFAALYAPQPGVPLIAAPELTKTTRPPPALLRSAGAAAFSATTRLRTLTSSELRQDASGTLGSAIRAMGSIEPAFRTRASIDPNCSMYDWIVLVRDCSSALK